MPDPTSPPQQGELPPLTSTPRRKDSSTLQRQVAEAEAAIGEKILPPGVPATTLEATPFRDLKADWRFRAEVLVEALRTGKLWQDIPAEHKLHLQQSLRILNNLTNYLVAHEQQDKAVLREPQIKVVEDILAALERGENRFYVKCPTGYGKTVIFACVAAAMGIKTLVAVPKRLLVGQTTGKFEKFAPGVRVAEIYGERKQAEGDVNIMTYDYIYDQVAAGYDLSQYGLIILDEAHKVLEPAGLKLLKKIPPHIKTIGFTATPEYNEDKSLDNYLGECCHNVELVEGIRLGCLSPCSVFIAKTGIDLSGVPINKDGKYDEATFLRLYKEKGINKACTQLYQKAFAGQQAIGFCASVAQAEDAAAQFNEAGITAAFLSGDTSKKERERIFKAYEKGDIKVLFSADLLIEGFDSEVATVCFNLAPTRSIVNAEQRGGRVLRLNPNNLAKHAVVIDFLFEDSRAIDPPVFFAEILNGNCCPPEAEQEEAVRAQHEAIKKSLADISIDGLTVVVDNQEVMTIVNELNQRGQKQIEARTRRELEQIDELKALRAQVAPEGWVSLPELAKLAGRGEAAVRNSIQRLGASVKHLYGRYYIPEFNRRADRYAPELAEKVIEERYDHLLQAGWLTLNDLSRALNTDTKEIQRNFPQEMIEGVHFVAGGFTNHGHKKRYFSPALLEYLRTKEFRPKEYQALVMKQCTTLFKAPPFVVNGYIEYVKSKLPSEFYLDQAKKIGQLCVTKKFEEELERLAACWNGRKKDCTITVSELARYLGTEIDVVIAEAQRYASQQNSVTTRVDGRAKIDEAVTSETVLSYQADQYIRRVLCPKLNPPDGWQIPRIPNGWKERIASNMFEKLPEWWRLSFKLPGQSYTMVHLPLRAFRLLEQVNAYEAEQLARGVLQKDIDRDQTPWQPTADLC